MIAVLLGAGFSKWAANLPLAAELFDFDITPHNRRDKQRLVRISELKCEWDVRNPGGLSEQFIFDAIHSSQRARRLAVWYITRRLSEPFVGTMLGGTQALMIDDRRKLQHEGIRRARSFLLGLSHLRHSGLITTNYDLLIEYALGSDGFNYGVLGQELAGRGKNPWFPWQGLPVRASGNTRLAKIHGSVSWDERHHYTDGRCGVRGDALIVPPSPAKEPPESLRSTWELAASILEAARYLLVFGFAFNPYDEAVSRLLRTAGSTLQKVLLVDLNPKSQQANQVCPNALVTACPPPPEGDANIAEWLASSAGVR